MRAFFVKLWSSRRRVAPLVLALGLLAIGGEIFAAWPRETEIRYDFGPNHAALHVARVAYLSDGEEAMGARFAWDSGAPASMRHVVDLEPGRYEVVADLEGDAGHARVSRALVVPADGVVRIALFDEDAYARRLP